jgi:predicted metal-dependent HD superfamily phosphohydrolase
MQLLVDIDLSILGAAPERFDEYETQVRAEYRWVPDFMFKPKRREILGEFLARDRIYATPVLRAQLEAHARMNLARSIARLAS